MNGVFHGSLSTCPQAAIALSRVACPWDRRASPPHERNTSSEVGQGTSRDGSILREQRPPAQIRDTANGHHRVSLASWRQGRGHACPASPDRVLIARRSKLLTASVSEPDPKLPLRALAVDRRS